MATVRNTNTIQYGATHTYGTRYGEFKFGARKYGAVAEGSAGGKIPQLSTREM